MPDKAVRLNDRAGTRLPVSKDTLMEMKERLRGGEAYDTLIRRILMTMTITMKQPMRLNEMSDEEQSWVLNETKN